MDSLALAASAATCGCVSFRFLSCHRLSAVRRTSIAMSPSKIKIANQEFAKQYGLFFRDTRNPEASMRSASGCSVVTIRL